MSMFMLWAAPQMPDPTANMRMNARRIGLRPKPSARWPTKGIMAVEATVKALPTQMKSVPFKSPTIVGRQVETAIWVIAEHIVRTPVTG